MTRPISSSKILLPFCSVFDYITNRVKSYICSIVTNNTIITDELWRWQVVINNGWSHKDGNYLQYCFQIVVIYVTWFLTVRDSVNGLFDSRIMEIIWFNRCEIIWNRQLTQVIHHCLVSRFGNCKWIRVYEQ